MVILDSAHSAEIHVPVYFLHLFKLRFFIAKCIHCQCTIYISIYFQVTDLQKSHETLRKLKNAQNSLWEAGCNFKNWSLWIWSLARMEQFSLQMKSKTSQQTWNRFKALKLCAIYPQSFMEFLTILGNTAFRHTEQIQSLHHHNLAPWHKTASDIAQILFATSHFIFWG